MVGQRGAGRDGVALSPGQTTVAAGYVPWVRAVSTRLAALPGVVAIQIGNEANNTGSAAAGDGAYPGAVDAIAHGVPAARRSGRGRRAP